MSVTIRFEFVFYSRFPTTKKIKMELNNANNGDDESMASWEIGELQPDLWKEILMHLSDWDLVRASQVCVGFRAMSEDIFEKRRSLDSNFHILFDHEKRSDWQRVVRRFRNFIKGVSIEVPDGEVVHHSDFYNFERCMSKTLNSMFFFGFKMKQWEGVAMLRQFGLLETMHFMHSNLSMTAKSCLFTHFSSRYPRLKNLHLTNCKVTQRSFLEQSIPSLERASFCNVETPNDEFLLIFLVKNRQLKSLSIDFTTANFANDVNISLFPKVNEISVNLEILFWRTVNLSSLPTLRQNFSRLKNLTFSLNGFCDPNYKYKNELLPIIRFFPVLESLSVTLIPYNLMTNDDLIDLLTHSTCTLNKFIFSSLNSGLEAEMKFGYDLHRRIIKATSDRPDITIEIEYGTNEFKDRTKFKNFFITRDCIKENGEFIVLRDSSENQYGTSNISW